MAREEVIEADKLRFIMLSRHEAVQLIARLTAQLADTNVDLHARGACPEIKLVDRGVVVQRLSFAIDPMDERPAKRAEGASS